MRKSRFTEMQIVGLIKEAEARRKVADICREHGGNTATFYQWRSKYSGMEASDVKQLKELKAENDKLKRMYADMASENQAIRDAGKALGLHQRRWAARFLVEKCKKSIAAACRIVGLSRRAW